MPASVPPRETEDDGPAPGRLRSGQGFSAGSSLLRYRVPSGAADNEVHSAEGQRAVCGQSAQNKMQVPRLGLKSSLGMTGMTILIFIRKGGPQPNGAALPIRSPSTSKASGLSHSSVTGVLVSNPGCRKQSPSRGERSCVPLRCGAQCAGGTGSLKSSCQRPVASDAAQVLKAPDCKSLRIKIML